MLKNDAIINEQELPFPDYDESDQIYDEPDTREVEYCYVEADCETCSTLYEYNRLVLAMAEEINFLRAEVVRWRQVLIKYLSPEWADGLKQDILDNVFRNFHDYEAYEENFLNNYCHGKDPMENEKLSAMYARLIKGTDKTSIKHL